MKIRIWSMVFVATFLLCGCSSPKFTKYPGMGVLQGSGGEVRSVDGIDIWEHGEPARKYEILGSVDGIPHGPKLGRLSRLFSQDRDSAIAKVAKDHGGDAILLLRVNREKSDEDQLGEADRQQLKLVVIKYVK
jgi:hypothetical protein